MSQNTFFEECLRKAASEVFLGSDCLELSFWTVAINPEIWWNFILNLKTQFDAYAFFKFNPYAFFWT